jgi:2-C-methyl-D-erythritol 4-phosphate cytidylyltransferase
MDSVAIVLASGQGVRFDNKTSPKHLTPILDVPVLVWSLSNIIKANIFSKIFLVLNKSTLETTKEIINQYFSFSKNYFYLVEGADSRMGSFTCGLKKYEKLKDDDLDVIISLFDANRPFLNKKQIELLYNSAVKHGCSCPASPVVNGIAKTESDRIVDIPDKENFFEFVTPEFIKLSILKNSMESSESQYKSFVEYALASRISPKICESGLLNIKLTYPNDKALLDHVAMENKFEKPKKQKNRSN